MYDFDYLVSKLPTTDMSKLKTIYWFKDSEAAIAFKSKINKIPMISANQEHNCITTNRPLIQLDYEIIGEQL